jgi:TM2 domain-containing membrane protein YozV
MKQRGAAAALAIFLGGFGAHKFYLNKPGQAIFYVILCWTLVPSVIGLIEGIRYACMSNDSFNRKYNTPAPIAPVQAVSK